MKILIIIISHDFSKRWCNNIVIFKKYMQQISNNVEYAGICSIDEFHNYEDIISFQYKIINPKRQFSKICDFITEYKYELQQYDWFIKIRPEVFLFEKFQFHQLSSQAINARARHYVGPRKILYGSSIGGLGSMINDYYMYDTYEHDIILDDHIFIFHKNIIDKHAFDKFIYDDETPENEYYQSNIWESRNIDFHVIGINMVMQKYNYYSGHIPKNLQRPKKPNIKLIFT